MTVTERLRPKREASLKSLLIQAQGTGREVVAVCPGCGCVQHITSGPGKCSVCKYPWAYMTELKGF